MAKIEDWITAAVSELLQVEHVGQECMITDSDAAEIIRKHCPFNPGVVYMPVPRCATCRHWERSSGHVPQDLIPVRARGAVTEWGSCTQLEASWGVMENPDSKAAASRGTMATREDFGCVEHEPMREVRG